MKTSATANVPTKIPITFQFTALKAWGNESVLVNRSSVAAPIATRDLLLGNTTNKR
jgi:hypothetical protein